MATYRDIENRIRLRLGEVSAGTYGIEDYENEDNVDEIKMEANAAQIAVCRDIWTQQWMPFRRINDTIPIVSGQTIYTLPQEFIQMVSITHKKGDEAPLPLRPKILSKYKQTENYNTSYFQYYEITGQIAEIITEGTVTWVDEAYQFAADQADLQDVRVGDVVNNLTDGSQGVITNFGSGIATLGNRLHGGRSNRMQYGDEFTIQTREESRFALETWPEVTITPPNLTLTQQSNSTGVLTFQTTADASIETIQINLPTDIFLDGNELEDYNSQDRLLLYIIDNSETPATTVDVLGFQDAKAGTNTLNVIESEIQKGLGAIQFNRGTEYQAYIVEADTQMPLISLDLTDRLTLLEPTRDFLIVNFVKRPAPFLIPESTCELYQELEELVVEKTVLSLLRKKDPKMVNASVQQFYKALVDDAKNFVAGLLSPENMDIDTEVAGLSTHTPLYTSYYW